MTQFVKIHQFWYQLCRLDTSFTRYETKTQLRKISNHKAILTQNWYSGVIKNSKFLNLSIKKYQKILWFIFIFILFSLTNVNHHYVYILIQT